MRRIAVFCLPRYILICSFLVAVGFQANFFLGLGGVDSAAGQVSSEELRLLGSVAHARVAKCPGRYDVSDVAEKVISGVVHLSSSRSTEKIRSPLSIEPFFRYFFPDHPFGKGQSPPHGYASALGSGVIVEKSGIVLTNNHLVQGADKITARLHDGRVLQVKVVGSDPKTDLAVLQLIGDLSKLRPITMGDSDALRLGEKVVAIGNPFSLERTVTMGIVSAKGRSGLGVASIEHFIQTDAAINPGNSGGPLVNMDGELIGINTAIRSRSGGFEGIGFAIPSNIAKAIKKSIMEHGRAIHGWLGIALQPLTPKLGRALGVKESAGVLITQVVPGSPAEKAGLRRGDLIASVGGRPTRTIHSLRSRIAIAGAGTRVAITAIRETKKMEFLVTLGEMLADGRELLPSGGRQDGSFAGLRVRDVVSKDVAKYDLPRGADRGAIVVDAKANGIGARGGVRVGDILLEINRRPIRSSRELVRRYRASKGQVLLLIYRRGRTFYLLLNK